MVAACEASSELGYVHVEKGMKAMNGGPLVDIQKEVLAIPVGSGVCFSDSFIHSGARNYSATKKELKRWHVYATLKGTTCSAYNATVMLYDEVRKHIKGDEYESVDWSEMTPEWRRDFEK